MEDKPLIRVNMLGRLEIVVEDRVISDRVNRSKKPWNLLAYIITFRDKKISQNEMIDLIWSNSTIDNPAGALKTLLFRVRKQLDELEYPDEELILQKRGAYFWNKNLPIEVDTDVFEDLCNKAASTDDLDEKEAFYKEAVALYVGDFMPRSETESWVVPIHAYYHALYMKIIHEYIELVKRHGDYKTIENVCRKAVRVEAFDEKLHYELVYALYKQGNSKKAKDQYEKSMDMFFTEFGMTPSMEFKALYKEIVKTSKSVEADLSVIKDYLAEEEDGEGAFYCEFEFFRDMYRLEARSAQRTGDSVYICLLTVTDYSNKTPEQRVLNRAMKSLKESIQGSLRRGDVFTRYSVSQYIIMLPTVSYENGKTVLQRIVARFHKEYTRRDIAVNFKLQPIIDNMGEKKAASAEAEQEK